MIHGLVVFITFTPLNGESFSFLTYITCSDTFVPPYSCWRALEGAQPVEHLLAALVGCKQATAAFVARQLWPRDATLKGIHSLTHTHSLSFTHTHTHTHTHSLSHTHIHTHTHSHTLTGSHTPPFTQPHTLSHSHTLTHSHSLTHSLTH